jgi:hypothetical protein
MELGIERSLRLRNVASQRTQHLSDGGYYLVYLSCASFIILSVTTPKLVWVRPQRSRRWTGFWHSLPSLLLGWWSLGGLVSTPLVLTHNLLGGFDMTGAILHPRTSDGVCRWESADVERRFQRHRFSVFIVVLVVAGVIGAPALLFLLLDVLPRWIL